MSLQHARPYAEGIAELHTSGCLCPPEPSPPPGHMCVHGCRLWARRADGTWWRAGHVSIHFARRWLELVDPGDGWDDVVAALGLSPLGGAP